MHDTINGAATLPQPASAPKPAAPEAYMILATAGPETGFDLFGDEACMPFMTRELAAECARRIFPPARFPDTHWWVVAVLPHEVLG